MIYLITGGSGSLGQTLVQRLIGEADEIRVYSRDEYKQSEMARVFPSKVTYWLGDVCDLERLKEACEGVDVIIHTAALKRMDTTSHNTYAVANTNITGTYNVSIAGKNAKKIVMVSTDKAFSPSCIYGASKMIAESIILACKNGVVWRFGNFIGSRGSVWEIFKEQAKTGWLTITDPNATRFVIPIYEVVEYLIKDVNPGLHYPENLKSMTVGEIAKEICPDCKWKIVGLREGEKLHEAFNHEYSSNK